MVTMEITKNQLKKKYNCIIKVVIPQDNLVYKFFKGIQPNYYNCGKHGLNWAVYEITEDTCVLIGQRQRIGEVIPTMIWRYYANEVSFFEGADASYINDIRLNFVDDVQDYLFTHEIDEKFILNEQ